MRGMGQALATAGGDLENFPCSLATMWTYVTEDHGARTTCLSRLAHMLDRPAAQLGDHVLVGSAEDCAAKLRAYELAGIDTVFVWPLADAHEQLERVMHDVAPLV